MSKLKTPKSPPNPSNDWLAAVNLTEKFSQKVRMLVDRYQRLCLIAGGGSFPLIEEFFDGFRNEDGAD